MRYIYIEIFIVYQKYIFNLALFLFDLKTLQIEYIKSIVSAEYDSVNKKTS